MTVNDPPNKFLNSRFHSLESHSGPYIFSSEQSSQFVPLNESCMTFTKGSRHCGCACIHVAKHTVFTHYTNVCVCVCVCVCVRVSVHVCSWLDECIFLHALLIIMCLCANGGQNP